MPELPEIEVLRRDLEKEIVSRRIKGVEVRPGTNAMKLIRRHGRRKEFEELLDGAKVDKVDRAGRLIALLLDNDRALVVDVGHNGRLLKTSASDTSAAHTHLVIGFTIGGQLRFVNPKLDGEIFVTSAGEWETLRKESTAIDPLENQPFTWQHFSSLISETKRGMKDLLMDERFVCSLGDLYSDEVLFTAGIRFDRQSDSLSSQDVRRLYRSLMETLQDAVKARGTSWGEIEFTDLQGDPGQYQLELKVYEREGESCRRCRHEIVREEFNGGVTYLCPQCQT